jgi:hypothetical protein
VPQGVYWRRGTPNTRGLFPVAFREMEVELVYCSEAYNDDMPYWVDVPSEKGLPDGEKKGMLIVPYNYDCNGESLSLLGVDLQLIADVDGRFYLSSGFVGSNMYEKYLKSTFDMLYREGGKMMNISMHSRIGKGSEPVMSGTNARI